MKNKKEKEYVPFGEEWEKYMSTHTNPRRDKARKLADETGCSLRTAYRKIAAQENRKFNQKAEYEVNKGKDV